MTDASRLQVVTGLNAALQAANLADKVRADLVEDRVRLLLLSGRSIQIDFDNPLTNPIATQLGFVQTQRNAWAEDLDVVGHADVKIVDPSFVNAPLSVASGGNLNGDRSGAGNPIDDMVIGNPQAGNGAVYVFHGSADWTPLPLLPTADFTGLGNVASTDGFELGADQGLWNISSVRSTDAGSPASHSGFNLRYGTGGTAAAGGGNYDTPGSANNGVARSPVIDLTSVPDNVDVNASFSYFLHTEAGGNIDRATVAVRRWTSPAAA